MKTVKTVFSELLVQGTECGAWTDKMQIDLESMLHDFETAERNMRNVLPYMKRLCEAKESSTKLKLLRERALAL